MSIRRISGGSPFVSLPPQVEGEQRVDAVERYRGTENASLESPEEALLALQQAELEQLDAEQAERERESQELRAKLLLADGYEPARRELVDLKGGAEVAAAAPRQEGGGLSLASLARANVYAAARAQEATEAQAAAEARATAEARAAADSAFIEAASGLLQLDGLEGVDGLEDGAPEVEPFFASVDDIAFVDPLEEPSEDPGADAFHASLDDIAHFLPAEAQEPVAADSPVAPESAEVAPEAVELPFRDE